MPKHALLPRPTWVFDLDNTLYPPEARLFDQIEVRMTDWVMHARWASTAHEANRLRDDYWAPTAPRWPG